MQMQMISRRTRSWLAAALILLTLGGCSKSNRPKRPTQNMDRITGVELITARAEGISSLEEAISRLRPRWLKTDRIQSFDTGISVLIYDGETMLGGPDVLGSLGLDNITEVRWMNSAQAGTLPGAGSLHVEGAIVIFR